MKKLILSVAIVLGSLSSFATTLPTSVIDVKTTLVQDEFTEIKIEELPVAIVSALKKEFPGIVLNKAYVSAEKDYIVDVTTVEGGRERIIADAAGNLDFLD